MPANRPKLLLIEDDKIDQMAFGRWMKEECPQFDCSIVGSVAEAKKTLGASTFDIIVTDYQLGDGLAFEIFPLAGSAPLILTTASGDEGVAVKALKSGAYDYLIKDPDRNYLKLLRFTLERSIDRKKAENQLKMLSEAVYTISDCVCISDEARRIIFVNRAFCTTYGYAEEDVLGQEDSLLWAHPVGAEEKPADDPPAYREGDVVHKRKNGDPFDVSYSQSILSIEGSKKTVAVIREVTERHRMEAALRQSEKIMAVGQLAAGIAHEINNPLCIILGAAQAVLHRIPAEDPVNPMLKSIEKESLRCRDLVQSLLSFSRTPRYEKSPVDLNAAVQEALMLVEAQLKVTQVTAQKTLAAGLPLIMANLNQLQQVVINLATNAIDAMNGQGTLAIQTGPGEIEGRKAVALKIRDTGAGIPEKILPRIFEPFFTTKGPGKGTGLGLALVYEIVKRWDGHITVDSRPGHTEFTVLFPV